METLDILIEAARLLKDMGRPFRLNLIISKEPEKLYSKILGLIKMFSLDVEVEIYALQPPSSLHDHIAKSDAVIIPSYSEGFCYAAIEAMAIGAPIISSGQGALSEVIGGRFIEMKTFSPQSLCDAMSDAIDGMWSNRKMQHYDLDTTVKKYIELYKALKYPPKH